MKEKVREQKGEPEARDDLLVGRNAVIEALRSGRGINKLLVAEGSREGSIAEIIALARERGVIVQTVDRSKLNSMAGEMRHQGVAAQAAPVAYAELEDIKNGFPDPVQGRPGIQARRGLQPPGPESAGDDPHQTISLGLSLRLRMRFLSFRARLRLLAWILPCVIALEWGPRRYPIP